MKGLEVGEYEFSKYIPQYLGQAALWLPPEQLEEIAKGQIVREIDALGGQMGLVTDETAIQFRILNRSKGPAMWSPRAQCDRAKFIWSWRERLENTPNLHIWQDTVCELLVENGEVTGLVTVWGVTFKAKCIVLTAGTFLNGLMHIGRHKLPGGRMAEPASYQLTESIARHGITYGRMKTGTPVRIDARSVHFDRMETQDGECDKPCRVQTYIKTG